MTGLWSHERPDGRRGHKNRFCWRDFYLRKKGWKLFIIFWKEFKLKFVIFGEEMPLTRYTLARISVGVNPTNLNGLEFIKILGRFIAQCSTSNCNIQTHSKVTIKSYSPLSFTVYELLRLFEEKAFKNF